MELLCGGLIAIMVMDNHRRAHAYDDSWQNRVGRLQKFEIGARCGRLGLADCMWPYLAFALSRDY